MRIGTCMVKVQRVARLGSTLLQSLRFNKEEEMDNLYKVLGMQLQHYLQTYKCEASDAYLTGSANSCILACTALMIRSCALWSIGRHGKDCSYDSN